MSRRRVPLERLLADLRNYHTYLLQDPCVNPRALDYVEARISLSVSTSSPKSASTDCGELAGSEVRTSHSGHRAWRTSNAKATVTT